VPAVTTVVAAASTRMPAAAHCFVRVHCMVLSFPLETCARLSAFPRGPVPPATNARVIDLLLRSRRAWPARLKLAPHHRTSFRESVVHRCARWRCGRALHGQHRGHATPFTTSAATVIRRPSPGSARMGSSPQPFR
jgi:hypothetical protein